MMGELEEVERGKRRSATMSSSDLRLSGTSHQRGALIIHNGIIDPCVAQDM